MDQAVASSVADSGAHVVVGITGVCGIYQAGPEAGGASGIDVFMPSGLFPRESCRQTGMTIPIHVPFLRLDGGRVVSKTGSLPRYVRKSTDATTEFYSLLGRKVEIQGVSGSAELGDRCELLSVTGTCDSRKYSAAAHPDSRLLSARVALPPGIVTTPERPVDYQTQDDKNSGRMKPVAGARVALISYRFASEKHSITVKASSLAPGAEPEATLTIEPDAGKPIVLVFAQATEGDILGASMDMGGTDVHVELMFDLLSGDDKRHVHTLSGTGAAGKNPYKYWPKGTNCPPIMLR